MADTSWMNNPKLKNIDPRKMALLLEIVKEADGKSMEQLIPIMMNVNKRLQQQNMNFSKDETDLMMEAISRNLSPKEKAQFEMIKKFMATRK